MAPIDQERQNPRKNRRIRHHDHDAAATSNDERNGLADSERRALRIQQAQSIMRMTPWNLLLNIAAALVLLLVGYQALPGHILLAWSSANILLSLLILLHWRMAIRRCASRACAAGYVRAILVQGILLGIVWSLPPLLFMNVDDPELSILVVVLTLGAFSLGAFRLSQVPIAAAFYVGLPTASLTVYAIINLSGAVGAAAALFCMGYAGALMLMVMLRYHDAVAIIRNQAELKRQRDIIRLLLHEFEEKASDWLWEADADGRLTHVTPRLVELTGMPADSLVGKTLSDVLGAEEQSEAWRAFREALRQGRKVEGQVLPACIRGRRRWYRLYARPLNDAKGNLIGFRGVASDVTAQVLSERKLKREKEEAQRAAQARTDFLALVSHELRTPLNALIGFSELLEKESAGPLATEYQEYARHISDGARQLSRLINDILDYTRFERKKLRLMEQDVELIDLAEMAMRQIARDPRAVGLDLRLDAPEGELLVRGDPVRLKQVLDNLLTNAVKFTDEGEIRLHIGIMPDGGVKVSVTDTGPGVNVDDTEKLFEPFQQAEGTLTRRHDGIGLGLPIARSLIRLHGGDLWLEEAEEGGCRAVFTIPPERVLTRPDDPAGKLRVKKAPAFSQAA